ncbi:DUF692 family multinuclear iron-containing protein [Glaciecola siphonariae]|uniref:DUF692 family multinuclear iron-containing protein n=1 Tax=Glaciecola siphonariae TaxID=521012 RepID=A0ABV9LVX5_9ALTE
MLAFKHEPKPDACIGLGLRHLHYDDALAHQNASSPVDFVEVHAENFFARGGITRALLSDVKEKYPISVHGTSLGLGSAVGLPASTLQQFVDLVSYTEAMLVSEHLCFNRAAFNNSVYHTGDLLPIAYNNESLEQIVSNIQQVQDAIKQPILIENLSAYVAPSALSELAIDSMDETEFLIQMCKSAGCGLLLDINNLIVNALNQKTDRVVDHVIEKMKALPSELVGEIHLAGFSEQQVAGFIIDDHGQAVSKQCWDIYKEACSLFKNVPTLVEWDNNLPEWSVLLEQTAIARAIAKPL